VTPCTGAPMAGRAPAKCSRPPNMRHMYDDGTRPEQVAAVKAIHSEHASNNPKAFYKQRFTVDDVLKSRFICKPLHLLDCCVETDNGTAIVVTNAERAHDCRHPRVLIRGVVGRCNKPRLLEQLELQLFELEEGQARRRHGWRSPDRWARPFSLLPVASRLAGHCPITCHASGSSIRCRRPARAAAVRCTSLERT